MARNGKNLRVLVTDAHEWAGLGAIRSLGRAGCNVVGGYPQGHTQPPSISSRYCAEYVTYPDPWIQQFEFRDWLLNEIRRGQFEALLPITEAVMIAVSSLRQDLSKYLLLLLPTDENLKYALSKYQATQAAQEAGVCTPETVFVKNVACTHHWNEDISTLRLPVVIKSDNYLTVEGQYIKGKTTTAASIEEAAKVLGTYRQMPTSVIVQEKISGHGVGAFLLRFGGHVQLRFAHRRLHEIPYTGGYSSLRVSSRNEAVIEQAMQLLQKIDYEGVAMVEFLLSDHNQLPYFLELNGRLWGSIALALHAGVDFPRAILEQQQLGHLTFKQANYPANLRCRNTPGELRYLTSVFKAANAGIGQPPSRIQTVLEFILLSLNPRVRRDHFWLRDPGPGVIAAKQLVSTYLRPNPHNILTKLGSYTVFKLPSPLHYLHTKIQKKWREYQEAELRRELLKRHQSHSRQPTFFDASPTRLLFLCYGNICRSPFAEAYWNKRVAETGRDGPQAISAGFHPEKGRLSPARFVNLAHSFGVDLSGHRSQRITAALVKEAGAIFLMDIKNYKAFKDDFPEWVGKTFLLGSFANGDRAEIADPYSADLDDARHCYTQLAAAVDSLLKVTQTDI